TSTRRIYKIWKRHAEGIPLRKQQLIYSVVSSEIMFENNTLDRKSKKRNLGSSSRSVRISDSVNIPIKKIVEMDNLQATLAQNHKEREEAKREIKRVLDSN
ncbi:36141_t:CDS:1, partial [Racocetra persica]